MSDINKEYRSLSVNDAADIIYGKKQVLIIFHVHPDGDAVGSSFALRTFLESVGCRSFCICADVVPERLQFATEGQTEFSYASLPEDFSPDLVISVDTASPSQMGSLYDVYQGRVDLMIDHHEKGIQYADYCIDHTAAACGEVMFEILCALKEKYEVSKLPQRVCELLYTAISSDTGCFRYNNVTPQTHILASELISQGVPSADINHRLFGIKTLKQMQVEHAGFERMNFYCEGRLAVITFPYDLKTQYGAEDEALETLIDVARCIKGVEVAAVVKQPTSENKYRVSMRSISDFDVSEICALYGGGGHVRAAGCTLTSDSILSAEMTIVVAVEQRLNDKN